MAGMLSGLIITLFYVFAHKGLFFVKGTEYLDLIGGPNSFFGITPEAFGAVGALVNFVVAYVVDKFTPEPPEHIQRTRLIKQFILRVTLTPPRSGGVFSWRDYGN